MRFIVIPGSNWSARRRSRRRERRMRRRSCWTAHIMRIVGMGSSGRRGFRIRGFGTVNIGLGGRIGTSKEAFCCLLTGFREVLGFL